MLTAATAFGQAPELATLTFYKTALHALAAAGVPFMVGGGFAFSRYTGIARYTKDLDVFVRPQDSEWALGTIATTGYRTEMIAPHWLGKAFCDQAFIDIMFSSGNGVAVVDDEWLEHARQATLFEVGVRLCPVEEMIWSKAYVLERERYDGADVAHLIRAHGDRLDWRRLIRRFERHWPVLFSHLLLFRFAYPSHRSQVPPWVLRSLAGKLRRDLDTDIPKRPVCQGTLMSARQYLVDVDSWGYEDARLDPDVHMTAQDIALLTGAIKADEARGEADARRDGPA